MTWYVICGYAILNGEVCSTKRHYKLHGHVNADSRVHVNAGSRVNSNKKLGWIRGIGGQAFNMSYQFQIEPSTARFMSDYADFDRNQHYL